MRQLQQYGFVGRDVDFGRVRKEDGEVEYELIASVAGRADAKRVRKQEERWLAWMQRGWNEGDEV